MKDLFDYDVWQEIGATVRQNRLRTVLTGFSVAWGIFMLVVLLGSGTGLANGVEYQFRDDAVNSIWIRAGETSVPYRGLKPGRDLQMTLDDYAALVRDVAGVEHSTARFWIRGGATVTYKGGQAQSFDVRPVHPGHQHLERSIITSGRFLNDLDLLEHRKVAVIGPKVIEAFFPSGRAAGEWISINGIPFRVVGVFADEGGEGEEDKVYIPITTGQRIFNGANRVGQIMFTTGTASLDESVAMAEAARLLLAERLDFSPDDERAVFINNNNERFAQFAAMVKGIRAFVWVVGIGTLLAGVVGVSNIMLITVRERTREIGVRKALGATPGSVVALVLQEAIAITAVAGYLGLVLGVATLELVGSNLPASDFFKDPHVELGVALSATALLVLAGAAAGAVPAVRAARIRPIEALRDE